MNKIIKCSVVVNRERCKNYAKYIFIAKDEKEYPVCDKCSEKLDRLRYLKDEDYKKFGI